MSTKPSAQTHYLTSILIEAGVVTEDQVQAGLKRQRGSGRRIGETLVDMGVATEEDIGWALARQLGLSFVDPRPEALDPELIRAFPPGLLRRLDALPLVGDDEALVVALADPTDPLLIEELEHAAGCPLRLAVATPTAIRRTLAATPTAVGETTKIRAVESGRAKSSVGRRASGATLLLRHLEWALESGATHIVCVPGRDALEVRYLSGERLLAVTDEPAAAATALVDRLEALGAPRLEGAACHVSGRARCPLGTGAIALGVSILKQDTGLAVTLDLSGGIEGPAALDALGLDPVDLACLLAALDEPAGLGLITGPPHCGGSTTLACLVAEMRARGGRCAAFGSASSPLPPEARVVASAEQAAAVWADVAVAHRVDMLALDGVLCGDAIVAALGPAGSGRWLVARTDWTDSFALLERLAAHANGRAALADRLRFVVQQRLLPTGRPSAQRPKSSRLAVIETLVVDAELRAALRRGEPAHLLRRAAEAAGFRPLSTRLEALVADGRVDAADAARAAA